MGMLPTEMNVADTSVTWNGRDWAMIMLPLPSNYHDRINLFAHELFHVAQPSLQLKFMNVDNNHLDKKDGRVYLRLELEALIKTVQATNERDINNHLTNALSFQCTVNHYFPAPIQPKICLNLTRDLQSIQAQLSVTELRQWQSNISKMIYAGSLK